MIVNLQAGKKISQADIFKIESLLEKKNYIVETYCTKGPKDATEFVLKKANNFDIVMCCGGDGTFHEVLNGILNLKNTVPVVFIPFGTTNDLAKSLKLPSNLTVAVDRISLKNASYQDVGLFNNKEYFSYIASFGAFCEVSYGTPQKLKNFFGKIAYVFESFRYIRKIKSYEVLVECNDEKIEGSFIFGAVTNSKSVAGFIELKTDAIEFDDGKLELLLLRKPKNMIGLIRLLLKLRDKRFDEKFVVLRHAQKVKIKINEKAPFTLDGEFAGEFSCVEINCVNKKLKLIK